MNLIDKLNNLPDVSFISNDTLEDTLDQLKGWYEEKYYQDTGERKSLDDGDTEKLILDAVGMLVHQVKEYIDFVGKQNLIKYATGAFLENMTASLQIFRKEGAAAMVTVRFFLSAPREEAYIVPKGTRCATGDDVFFSVVSNTEITAGQSFADVTCACESAGTEGNGYQPGEINILVDPLPYVESVQNTDISGGGADPESDDDLAERFLLAPSAFNAWGGELYYEYHVKKCNANIGDVVTVSPEPCIVNISFILKDGSIPNDAEVELVQKYLDEDCVREIGDVVTVKKPDSVGFNVDFDYYVNESDREGILTIIERVGGALDEYIRWQTEQFGRDINPDMLRYLVMKAGVKRITIREPLFCQLGQDQIAVCGGRKISFGGLEDD